MTGPLFPANYSKIWVRGKFITMQGQPLRGKLTLQPNVTGGMLVNRSAGLIMSAAPFEGSSDNDTGYVALQVPATNDPDITPVGFTYTVKTPTGQSYPIVVPYDTPVLNSVGDPLHGQQVLELIDVVPAPGASSGVGQLLRGIGIQSIVDNGVGSLLITYTDGSTSTIAMPATVQGPPGPAGLQGDPGPAGPTGPTGPAGGGATNLVDLADVTTTGAAVGGVLAVTHVTGGGGDAFAVHPGIALVTGSTHADVQAAIDAATPGDTLSLVSEFTCTATITVNKRVTLTGPGTLNFTSGVDHGVGLLVTAPGAVLAGLRVVNANALGDGTGNANRGISIAASDVTVRGCDIEKWQYGIAVDSTGEFQNHRILSNRIVVLGAGGGAADTGSQGEDRGDGITTWGSVATITGNIVTALAGTDARIGIHAEALSDLNTVTPAHTDRMVTITGNTVTGSSDGTGKFRRGIIAEQVDNVTITGNAVADATWWGIGLVDTTDCVVSANVVLYSRTASDNHGSYWNPRRCGIMVTSLGASANNKVADNTVRATSTASGNAFLCVKNVSGQAVDTLIEGNVCAVDAGADIDLGVWGDGASTRLRVLGNTLVGFSANGVDLYACADAEVKGNLIDGVSTPASSKGVIAQSDSAGIVISGNTIYRVAQAIERVNTARNMISLNMIREVTNGIEGFGCSNSVCTQNIIVVTSGTALANLTDGVSGNVVAQNILT